MLRKNWLERVIRSVPDTNPAPAPEPHEGDPAPDAPAPASDPAPSSSSSAKETQYGDTEDVQEAPAPIERPDWVPEKYWDETKYVEDGQLKFDKLAEDMAKANQEAQRKLFTKNEDLKKQLREELTAEAAASVPESPDGYEITFSAEVLPEDVQLNISEDDPVLAQAKEWAHKNNLSQDQFSDIMDMYAQTKLAEMPIWNAPDGSSGEGDKLGPNADARLDRVAAFAKQNLSREEFEAFSQLPATANMVKIVEGFMKAAGVTDATPADPTALGIKSRAELMQLQATPEYQRGDPAIVKEVQDGFRALARARGQ